MTTKTLIIIYLFVYFIFQQKASSQNLPPILILTLEEIGMRVQDDPYFKKMLTENAESSNKSHGSPFQVTGSTLTKSKLSKMQDFESRAKSMKEKFEKRQTKISEDFEERRSKMSDKFSKRLSILKKKHQERYDLWDRYVKRYLKDIEGYKKALINPIEFEEEERREEEERQREIERKIKDEKRKKQEEIERERERRQAEKKRIEKQERERERIEQEKERKKLIEILRKKRESLKKEEELRKIKEDEERQRIKEERRRKKREKERRKLEEERRKEELRKQQEEKRKLEEELRLLEEEEKRKEEERKRKDEERRNEPPKPKWNWKAVDLSLDHIIKNQSNRPTCAAFASIRAIEIKLAQLGKKTDLSEQYFYWASKPDCQRLPCSDWGSSYGTGIQASKRSNKKDIPLEASCPYSGKNRPNNQTQIPLNMGCHREGVAKVVEYEFFNSVDELPSFLDDNHPVIGGFTLSPAYYETKAFLSLADDKKLGQTVSHEGGHAFNIIGYMELPATLHRDEGKNCYIAANSWGYGWGSGGHTCISEAWLKKHFMGAFFAITSVK